MDKLGKMLFLHFEKALIVVFGLALLYSMIAYGPWTGREEFNSKLEEIAREVDSKKLIGEDAVPDFPNLQDELPRAVTQPEQPIPFDNLMWPLLPRETTGKFLPPADVAAQGSRGYISVTWTLNPNQPPVNNVTPVGVQVERAVLTADGIGPFENMTSSGDKQYLSPGDLIKLAQKYAPLVVQNQLAKSAGAAQSQQKKKAAYTLGDLFNAWHDGRITESEIRQLVRDGVRQGTFTSATQMDFSETMRTIGMAMMSRRKEVRMEGGAPPSPEENLKATLAELGYGGGGNFKRETTVVQLAPGKPEGGDAGKAAPKPAQPAVVTVSFDDVTTFIDPNVNPDQEYIYRVRFWTLDATEVARKETAGEPGPLTQPIASKPDTEFYLSGVSEQDNVAAVLVRKWIPASNSWASWNYQVHPGEEIGHIEVLPKTDSTGRPVVGAGGKRETQDVDFSTDCVLLAFRYRPRAYDKTSTKIEPDPVTGENSSVDKVERVLYITPQIIYSDRKGRLWLKWQNRTNVS